MATAPCSLIYLSHGSAELRAEALYSVLSYYKVARAPVRILVYTDAPEAFRQVLGDRPEIVYPAVTPAEWKHWRGRSDKVYLVKISLLGHAAQHYPGNLLFVDTDTIWQADPSPLFAQIESGQHLLHSIEERMSTGNILSRKVYAHFKGQVFTVGDYKLSIDKNTILYNSGVIGLASAGPVQLPALMRMADELFMLYDKHIMEQLALSMQFAALGPVTVAADYVLHYWNLKAARPLLAQLVSTHAGQSLDELYERFSSLNLAAVHQAEMAYRQLPSWRRTLLKMLGRQWQMPKLEAAP